MRKLTMVVATMALMLVGTAPALAQANSETFHQRVPINLVFPDSCLGEDVALSGTLLMVFRVTEDAAGGSHVTTHINPQGVTGVGLVTGAKYQGTGVTRSTENFPGPPDTYTFTSVNNFRIIGQGKVPNYLGHDLVHVTFAQGKPTATVTIERIECRPKPR